MELERSWYAIQNADILASRVDQAGLSSSSANLPENAKKTFIVFQRSIS